MPTRPVFAAVLLTLASPLLIAPIAASPADLAPGTEDYRAVTGSRVDLVVIDRPEPETARQLLDRDVTLTISLPPIAT